MIGPAAVWTAQATGVGGATGVTAADGPASVPASVPAVVRGVVDGAPPRGPADPVALRVPSVGVDAPVVAVGVDVDGAMAIPERVDEIGWYRFGPSPGAPAGSSVLAGHVDDRLQGDGSFAALDGVDPGDRIEVIHADGATSVFTVVARDVVAKDELPTASLFAEDGPPRLSLVTCDGNFDQEARRYVDNLVVTAVPVADAVPPGEVPR